MKFSFKSKIRQQVKANIRYWSIMEDQLLFHAYHFKKKQYLEKIMEIIHEKILVKLNITLLV